jgi:capsular polysaccharide biosynthesis protein
MNKPTSDPAAHANVPAAMKTPTERMRDFAAAVRRRWPAALLVFALTLASATALTAMRHKKYEATAQILLQPTDAERADLSPGSAGSPADAERDVNTYAQLITVDPVANAVRRELRLRTTPRALISQISVSGQATSNLVSIAAQDASPEQAARLATEFATQYQAYRRETAVQQINQALTTAEPRWPARPWPYAYSSCRPQPPLRPAACRSSGRPTCPPLQPRPRWRPASW